MFNTATTKRKLKRECDYVEGVQLFSIILFVCLFVCLLVFRYHCAIVLMGKKCGSLLLRSQF